MLQMGARELLPISANHIIAAYVHWPFGSPILQAQNVTTAIHSKKIHWSVDHNSITI